MIENTRHLFQCAALFIGLSASMTQAQSNAESQVRALIDQCGQTFGITVATRDCLALEDKRFGSVLERLYRQALAQAGASSPQVRDAQRAWIKAFQAECALIKARAAPQGSVFADVAQMGCELKWTIERIDVLEKLVR